MLQHFLFLNSKVAAEIQNSIVCNLLIWIQLSLIYVFQKTRDWYLPFSDFWFFPCFLFHERKRFFSKYFLLQSSVTVQVSSQFFKTNRSIYEIYKTWIKNHKQFLQCRSYNQMKCMYAMQGMVGTSAVFCSAQLQLYHHVVACEKLYNKVYR